MFKPLSKSDENISDAKLFEVEIRQNKIVKITHLSKISEIQLEIEALESDTFD